MGAVAQKGMTGSPPRQTATRHPLAGFVVALAVARGDLVQLPVHPGGASVENLHAVHADVAVARVGVLRVDGRERDERAAVLGPAFQHRQGK